MVLQAAKQASEYFNYCPDSDDGNQRLEDVVKVGLANGSQD